MKRVRIIHIAPDVINRIGFSLISSGAVATVSGSFASDLGLALIGAGTISIGAGVCGALGTGTEPVMVQIPWPIPMPTVTATEPRREPAAYPPAPGQCFVCGIIDPEREKSLGTANHPECVEWLGDWKPPVPHFEGRNRHPIILPSRSGITMGEFADNLRVAMGGSGRREQFVFTCKCPNCENHWSSLRYATTGHPKDCRCTACDGVHDARTQVGPHHRNCACSKCVKPASTPVQTTADAVRRGNHMCTVLCAHETHGDGPHDLCKCSTCVNNRGDSHTDQEIRAAYDDLNARYGGTSFPGHVDRVGCTCAVCKMAADYAAYKADVDSLPPMIVPGRLRQSLRTSTPIMDRNGHLSYRDMPPAQTLGYTTYPEHFELFEGVCVACKLIADYHARPQWLSKNPPDPGLLGKAPL